MLILMMRTRTWTVIPTTSRGVNKVPFDVSHVAFDVESTEGVHVVTLSLCCYSSLCIFPCILCRTCSNV